jgi:hypothetical protein
MEHLEGVLQDIFLPLVNNPPPQPPHPFSTVKPKKPKTMLPMVLKQQLKLKI